jgi:hypothetical protein
MVVEVGLGRGVGTSVGLGIVDDVQPAVNARKTLIMKTTKNACILNGFLFKSVLLEFCRSMFKLYAPIQASLSCRCLFPNNLAAPSFA